MRFVLTLEDVIWLVLLAIAILIILVGFVSSWIGDIGEKIIDKVNKSKTERSE